MNTNSDYEILKRETLYSGIFKFMRYTLRFRMFNGAFSPPVTREILETGPVVAVLPYDPILDQVVLIEQFRPGAINSGEKPWLLEIIAGRFEVHKETPAAVAKREAKEEANCDILDLYPICNYFVTPGACDEHLQLFCGRVDASEVGGIHGLAEEHEDIATLTLPTKEAFMLLQAGKIKTSPAIISLQWLKLNQEWLKQLWQIK